LRKYIYSLFLSWISGEYEKKKAEMKKRASAHGVFIGGGSPTPGPCALEQLPRLINHGSQDKTTHAVY